MEESIALKLTGQRELTKRQYAYFVEGKRPACKCVDLKGFMVKFDCGSPF